MHPVWLPIVDSVQPSGGAYRLALRICMGSEMRVSVTWGVCVCADITLCRHLYLFYCN